MEFGQVHHLEYYVNDLNRSNQFWSWFLQEMGYSKSDEWPSGASWAHPSGTYLVFVQVAKEYLAWRNSRQAHGLNHIAFMGKSVSQLDGLQKKFEDRAIRVLKRKHTYLCIEDPNGFAVEIYAP